MKLDKEDHSCVCRGITVDLSLQKLSLVYNKNVFLYSFWRRAL